MLDLAAGLEQGAEKGVILGGAVSHHRHQVLQDVAGQGELREDEQVGPAGLGFFGQGQVLFQVDLGFAEDGVGLGKGKGEPEYWAAVVKPGTVLYEVGGISEEAARMCFARLAHKMPVKVRFLKRRLT